MLAGFAAAFLRNPYYLVLGGRIIQGAGAAGTAPIAMALAGDLFSTKERSESMCILEAANGLGKVLSPIIGSAVALIVWYALFFSYALLSLPAALLIWFFVQEPELERERGTFRDYLQTIVSIFDKKGVSLFFNFLGGLVLPAVNTMVTSAAQSEQRGGITSLYGSVRFAGVALGPPAFSLLQEVNVPLMFLSAGGLALAAGLLGFLLIHEEAVLQPAGGSAGA